MIQELRTLLINGRSIGEYVFVSSINSVGLNEVANNIMHSIIGPTSATKREIETHADIVFKVAYSMEDTKKVCESIFDDRYYIGGDTSWYSDTFSIEKIEDKLIYTQGMGDFIELNCSNNKTITGMFYDTSRPCRVLIPSAVALAIYIKGKNE